MTYLFGGTSGASGQVAIFWAMIPHQAVQIAERIRCSCIHLPLARFLQWGLPNAFTRRLHGEMVRERDASGSTRDRSLFEQWRLNLEPSTADVNHVMLLELEARTRRLAWSVATSPTGGLNSDTAAGDRSFDKIGQMAVYITENYQEQIASSDIAAATGLHPNYARPFFERAVA